MSVADVLRFDRFVLHLSKRQLFDGDTPIELGARAFDLLRTLAQTPGRVLTKAELFAAAWPGVTVDENNLQVQVSALRKILGAKVIATVPGRGYQFTIAVGGAATAEVPIAPSAPSLFGRSGDLNTLTKLVDSYPLVTVTGPGGVGKTAVARALSQSLGPRFNGKVALVELAPVVDPALVPAAVAAALELKLQTGPAAPQIVARLAGDDHLLILDNCEHQIAAVAALIGEIARGAPGIKILATSQARLGLISENVHVLEPLATPNDVTLYGVEQSPAAALFAARAGQVMPGFEINAANAEVVSDICYRLDGIPLALELAAARVGLLGVEGVRSRLGQRLKLLTKGQRGAAARHQTLRAALEWSYDLLTPEEQFTFRSLGVFRGGFTGGDVQAIAVSDAVDEWASLDALSALIDRSLVARKAGGDPSCEPQFMLLETMAEFAVQKSGDAGEADAARARHAKHFAASASAVAGRRGDELRNNRNFARLDPQHDNLRAAFEWLCAHDRAQAFVLADCLAIYWRIRGHLAEARDRLNKLIDGGRDGVGDRERAQLLTASCGIYFELRDVERLKRIVEEAVPLWTALDDPAEIGLATSWQGNIAWMEGDHQTAKECYEKALPHFQRANHRGRIAETINNIATALIELGRPEDAYKILPEALAYHQSTNDTWGLAFCREVFGFALFAIGDLAACRTAWRAARDGYDAVGHAQRGILVRLCLTGAALRESDIDTARVCLTEALDRIASRSFHQEIADAICLCAQFAVATGDLEAATILFASAQHWIREWNVVLEAPIKFAAATAEARAREGLTAEVHAAATRLGDSLTVPLALSRARAAIAKNT